MPLQNLRTRKIETMANEDGTKSSRRKINAAGVAPEDVEAFVLTEVMNQDRRISEMSGKSRGDVKSLVKSA
jgi:hypothetical protein